MRLEALVADEPRRVVTELAGDGRSVALSHSRGRGVSPETALAAATDEMRPSTGVRSAPTSLRICGNAAASRSVLLPMQSGKPRRVILRASHACLRDNGGTTAPCRETPDDTDRHGRKALQSGSGSTEPRRTEVLHLDTPFRHGPMRSTEPFLTRTDPHGPVCGTRLLPHFCPAPCSCTSQGRVREAGYLWDETQPEHDSASDALSSPNGRRDKTRHRPGGPAGQVGAVEGEDPRRRRRGPVRVEPPWP